MPTRRPSRRKSHLRAVADLQDRLALVGGTPRGSSVRGRALCPPPIGERPEHRLRLVEQPVVDLAAQRQVVRALQPRGDLRRRHQPLRQDVTPRESLIDPCDERVAKASPELCSPEAPTSSGRFGSIQRPGITSIPCQPAAEVPNTSTATAKHSLEMPRSRNCSSVGADPEEDSSLTAVPPAISLIGGYQRTPTPVCALACRSNVAARCIRSASRNIARLGYSSAYTDACEPDGRPTMVSDSDPTGADATRGCHRRPTYAGRGVGVQAAANRSRYGCATTVVADADALAFLASAPAPSPRRSSPLPRLEPRRVDRRSASNNSLMFVEAHQRHPRWPGWACSLSPLPSAQPVLTTAKPRHLIERVGNGAIIVLRRRHQ